MVAYSIKFIRVSQDMRKRGLVLTATSQLSRGPKSERGIFRVRRNDVKKEEDVKKNALKK